MSNSLDSFVRPSSSRKNWLWLLLVVVALLFASITLFFIIGATRDSTHSMHGVLGSMVWATLGPHFVLASLLALIFGVIGYRRAPGRLAGFALILAVIALSGSAYITARIMSAAFAAGGAVNPARGLLLHSMQAKGPDESVIFRTVASQDLYLAIYKPVAISHKAPVLVYVHGGGFMTGSNVETDADLRWFSDNGWLVFSADYRLWTQDTATWDKAPDDIACAMAWVGLNAARYDGDSTRIALLGDSAGGNLAINVGYAAALGDNQSECGSVPVPAAVVVQYPAVDPLAIYDDGYPIKGFEPKMLLAGYIGGNPYELPDRVKAVSSFSYISNKAPPTLIFAPENDSIVPSQSVFHFADQASLAGVDVELVRIPFANHIYNQMASGSIGNQARLTITRRYLLERGLEPAL